MEQLLLDLNGAYRAHQTAWVALIDSTRNGEIPAGEIVDQLAATEEQQQACLRELLPPNTDIYVRTGSIYSAPAAIYPCRSVDEQVVTIHEVSMQLSPQHQHNNLIHSPFALTSSDSLEGIWLHRVPEYRILNSGLLIAFGGLRFEIQRLSATQKDKAVEFNLASKRH